MKVILKDAHGGAEFIRTLVAAASDMGLAFAGYPDGAIRAHLDHALVNMERGIADELGPSAAAEIMVTFKAAVIGHKHELEARGMGSA
jgi:hypothetical protein